MKPAARRLPFDRDVERVVLAELADPLHQVAALRTVTPSMFLDGRHQRILAARRAGETLVDDDQAYLEDCVRYAAPLTAGTLAAFTRVAQARARVLALVGEIDEILRDVA
jgi:hypothetical protein